MPTIFAIDGPDFGDLGAYSADVASLQTALIKLGQLVGNSALAALVLDGLIGPKTTAASNIAFTQYVSNAPNFTTGGAMTQAQVASTASTLAQLVNGEVNRRTGAAPPTAVTATVVKPATTVKPTVVPATPAISDTSTQIVKWAAIGLGGVLVGAVIYYIIRMRQGRPAFRGAEPMVDWTSIDATEMM